MCAMTGWPRQSSPFQPHPSHSCTPALTPPAPQVIGGQATLAREMVEDLEGLTPSPASHSSVTAEAVVKHRASSSNSGGLINTSAQSSSPPARPTISLSPSPSPGLASGSSSGAAGGAGGQRVSSSSGTGGGTGGSSAGSKARLAYLGLQGSQSGGHMPDVVLVHVPVGGGGLISGAGHGGSRRAESCRVKAVM